MRDILSIAEEIHEHLVKALYGSDARPRDGISEALSELLSGRSVILSAPPGYGKTTIPYCLSYLAATKPYLCQRAIHVLPLRSIIEDCYTRLFYEDGQARAPPLVEGVVARQSLDASGSPWLQKKLVLTTLDTFTMCSMRLPPAEMRLIARGYSLGHGLLARAAILASSVVFDEVHLFMEEGGKMASAFSALLRWLGAFSTPVCVMSATLPRPIETFLKAELGSGGKISVFKYGEDFRDKEFEAQRLQAAEGLRTRRPRKGDIDVVVKEAIEAYESYEKVLVVLNTVADCIKAAKAINSGGYNSVILHGRLVNSQRSERLKALRGRRWLAVCTQVVEAGVDISALYTITDAAPPCALVQRVGRTLRSKEDVCREGVISIILDEGAFANGTYKGIYDASLVRASFEYLLEHYGDMMWHLPKYPDRPGYEDFIGACYDRANFEVVIDRPLARELTSLLRGMVIMGRILSTLESLGGSFVRDEPLVLGFVNHLGLKEGDEIDNESQRKLREWQLPLSARDVFYVWGHETLAIALEFRSGKYLVKRERIRSTKELIRKLLSGRIYGILIPPEIYDEKLGLIIGRGG